MVGLCVSTTVTVNEPCATLLLASDAEQLTTVGPSANTDPEGAEQATATDPLTMSNAVAVNVNEAPAGPEASIVVSSGIVSCGGVVSMTVTVKVPWAELP